MSRQCKDWDWTLPTGDYTYDSAQLAVLMDIRDELKLIRLCQTDIRNRLNCTETMAIPRMLRRISANTAKPKKRKKVNRVG